MSKIIVHEARKEVRLFLSVDELRAAVEEFFRARGYRFKVDPNACVDAAIRSVAKEQA